MNDAMGGDDAPSTDMDSSSSSSTNVTKSPPPRSPPKSPDINAPPKSPGSAMSWPPIDAKAWMPKEIAAMTAEDGWPNQAAMALQALGAPKATFADIAKSSPTSPPDDDPQSPPPYVDPAIGKMVPKTPPKMLPVAAKKPAQAPQHQAEFATTSSKSAKWVRTQLAPVPAGPVHQAKAKQPGSQAPPQAASQGGYPASQASRQARKAMPIAPPNVPETPASSSHAPQHSTPASSSHAKQLPHSAAKAPQSQPKAQQTPPKEPAKAKPPFWIQAPSGQAKQPAAPDISRATGWKNKLAFFTKYWAAGSYEVTTNAIAQFTIDLERTQDQLEGISTKAMNPARRSWQANAYSLVHHYNQQNWHAINQMVYQWRRDKHFDNLVHTAESIDQTYTQDLRQPDWWTRR